MRLTAATARNYRQRAQGSSIPAPVGGWDRSSPLAAMDPKRAIVLDNWFPQASYIELRKGHAEHSDTGETVAVKTIMAYHSATTGSDKLFAISNDTIYDVTTSTAAATSVTTLTEPYAQHVNFTTAAGNFLFVVNGADNPVHYNGSAWANPAITGVTESDFVNVWVHKKRLFFAENDSTKIWYLPVDSVAGAASSFEFGSLMDLGGYIMAGGSWSFDGGSGPDDHFVVVTSQGQVIVFAGDDPSDVNAWSHVGTYNLPRPIGRRCIIKMAGDLVVLTEAGVLPLSKALIRDTNVDDIALSARIQDAFNDAFRNYGTNKGWQIVSYPRGHMVIVNVPITEGSLQHQYVVNSLTGAWCRFTGQNSYCWTVYRNRLFFGGNAGIVYEADIAAEDDGTPITADLKTAFNYFGNPGLMKRFQMLQPVIYADGAVAQGVTLNVDFEDSVPEAILAGESVSTALWDVAVWDVDTWPVEQEVERPWQSVPGIGYCAAVRVRVIGYATSSVPLTMQLNGFNITFEKGGFI